MKQQITLDSKELKEIVAKALGIPLQNVVQLRYSIAIEGIAPDILEQKIKALLSDV